MKMMSKIPSIKKLAKISVIIGLLSLMGVVVSDRWVKKSASEKVFSSTEEIPFNRVGLLLGTGKYLANGRINLYYQYRIDATVELYNAGKIEYVLISGDNSRVDYDEPTTMKEDLIKMGIPASKIFLDYAGFRTLDSIVRAKEIFDEHSVTIVSQQFHNERALFIASRKDVEAVGFNAKDVEIAYGIKTQIREKLARVKVVLDLIFGKKPKFLGDKVEIK